MAGDERARRLCLRHVGPGQHPALPRTPGRLAPAPSAARSDGGEARSARALSQRYLRAQLWTYACADALLEQRVWMAQARNTTYVTLHLREAAHAVDLELRPLCTYRDYHAHTRGGWSLDVVTEARGCRVTAFPGARPYRVLTDRGDFTSEADWYWSFHHRAEAERGLDTQEDLFRPGTFRLRLEPGEQVTFIATAEADFDIPAVSLGGEQ